MTQDQLDQIAAARLRIRALAGVSTEGRKQALLAEGFAVAAIHAAEEMEASDG